MAEGLGEYIHQEFGWLKYDIQPECRAYDIIIFKLDRKLLYSLSKIFLGVIHLKYFFLLGDDCMQT